MDISNKASDADYIREVEKTINNIRLSVTETLDEFLYGWQQRRACTSYSTNTND